MTARLPVVGGASPRTLGGSRARRDDRTRFASDGKNCEASTMIEGSQGPPERQKVFSISRKFTQSRRHTPLACRGICLVGSRVPGGIAQQVGHGRRMPPPGAALQLEALRPLRRVLGQGLLDATAEFSSCGAAIDRHGFAGCDFDIERGSCCTLARDKGAASGETAPVRCASAASWRGRSRPRSARSAVLLGGVRLPEGGSAGRVPRRVAGGLVVRLLALVGRASAATRPLALSRPQGWVRGSEWPWARARPRCHQQRRRAR